MSLTSILTAFITFILVYIIKSYSKKTKSVISNDNKKILRSNVVFGILGLILALLIIAVFVLGFYLNWYNEETQKNSFVDIIIIILVFGSVLFTSIYCFFYYFNHRVIFDENEFTVFNPWNVSKTISWDEVKDIEFNSVMQQYNIYSKNGHKVSISNIIYGLEDFKQQMLKFDPYLAHRLYH